MPAVFAHGVPDTHRVWHAVIARLHREDVIALSLPGFGSEIPVGFDCTKDAYCDWLRAELSRIEGPPLDPEYEWQKAERDPYAAPIFGSRLASRTNARFVSFSGCSHWWRLERPDDVAKQLEGHWS
jgi:pimeloyl-ACP methyl ester carboxylesterase